MFMKLTYDPRYNVAYLRLHEKLGQVDTIQLSDQVNVDVAPDGTVYGIEFLNANEQLRAEDHGHFVLVDESSGQRQEVAL
jgi:uncharacterized protein YuzE